MSDMPQAQSTLGTSGIGNRRDSAPQATRSSGLYPQNPSGTGETVLRQSSGDRPSRTMPGHPTPGEHVDSDSASVLGPPPSYIQHPDEDPSANHSSSHDPPSDQKHLSRSGSHQPAAGYPAPVRQPSARYAAPAQPYPGGHTHPPYQSPVGYPAPSSQPLAGSTAPTHHQYPRPSAPPPQASNEYHVQERQRPGGYEPSPTAPFEYHPREPYIPPPGPPVASYEPPASSYPPPPGAPYGPPHDRAPFNQYSPGYGPPHGFPGGHMAPPGGYPEYHNPGGHHGGKKYKKHGSRSGSGSGSGSDSDSSHGSGKKGKKFKKALKWATREFGGGHNRPSYGHGGGYGQPTPSGYPSGPSHYGPTHGGPSAFPGTAPGYGHPTPNYAHGAYAPPGPPGHQSPYPPYGGGHHYH